MKPVKSVCFNFLLRLAAGLLSISLAGCLEGSYSSTAPGSASRQALSALEVIPATTTATATTPKYFNVFSNNIFTYQPCVPPLPACPETLWVGNPLHSYSVDTVSGMPTLRGIEIDTPPVNSKSVAVSPSGRFIYILTGDQLYALSIGWNIFTEAEFTDKNLNPLDLYNALTNAGHITMVAASSSDVLAQLNAVLEQPTLYAKIVANTANLIETAEIKALKISTASSRSKLYSDLSESQQKTLVRLNRLMLELAYPALTPVNKGARVQHVIGQPIALIPAQSEIAQYKLNFSMVLEPQGKFLYVLGGRVTDGYSTDATTGVVTQIIKSALSVYARDPVTGQLVLSGTQLLGGTELQRLVFAPSGSFAYGSNNGSLHSYSVNRSNGLLTEIGTSFGFRKWLVADPYYNMEIDANGKFVYLIANSGIQINPDPIAGCPFGNKYQLGSLVYTFVVDANSGLLTQSGPPLDTTPHIISAVSLDAKGRFVQLLNTYEAYTSTYTPEACVAGSTSLLNSGAIYSNYVEQSSGKLISTGSLQAGGTQMPTGFVQGGMDSVSLTGEVSGRFLYLLNAGDIYVYSVDQANGALTVTGSPLTGATATAAPGAYKSAANPVPWPSVCFTNGVKNTFCTFNGSRAHSFTWAGN